jgi:hypothetical protein
MLSAWGVRLDDPLWKLLTLLGKRGFVVGYQWSSSNDGINGWLDFQETLELAELLVTLRQNGVGPYKTCSMKGNVKRKIFSQPGGQNVL